MWSLLRSEAWAGLCRGSGDARWDLVVVGGGIVGAGIAREAARRGSSVLLVERSDFASGTSSRSSKFVHGGLRYLAHGDVRMMAQSVRAREQLLACGTGLVWPIRFLLLRHASSPSPGLRLTRAVLRGYDVLAGRPSRQLHQPAELIRLIPDLQGSELLPSFSYLDAQTDDARLTLRLLSEATAAGAWTLNYVQATEVLYERGRVAGVALRDELTGAESSAEARVVVNATGAWSDQLMGNGSAAVTMRPLRGSHLVLAPGRLALPCAVSFNHPIDGRGVTIAPWEGGVLVGTTDLDHRVPLSVTPRISADEVAYLMAALDRAFGQGRFTLDDVAAAYAGVRPVVETGKSDPTKESREHVVRYTDGLLTVAGGKLTTYHLMARTALQKIPAPTVRHVRARTTALNPVPGDLDCPEPLRTRLLGRYADHAAGLLAAAGPGELEPIVDGSPTTRAELRWSARAEAVHHLDDLLLRRVRLGLLHPEGAGAYLPAVRSICQSELGWDDRLWDAELVRYQRLWRADHGVPDRSLIPAW